MKNVIISLILLLSFVVSAKVVQIEGEYSYNYSDDETIVQAKKKCLDFAKRDALEKFATYISSESVYKNYMTEKDEVVARSLGVLKNVVINEENIDRANSTIFYKVSAEIDEEEVLKKLEKKQEKNTLNLKIKDFVKSGLNAESQTRIGDALKYYYWALLLVKSEPKSHALTCRDLDDRLLTISLPEKINSILTAIDFKFKEVSQSRKYKNLNFEVKYKGQKIRNLVFTFFDGDLWSRPVKVRDGVGNIELFGDASESITKLSLKTGYMYEDQLNYDLSVKKAYDKVGHIPFSAAKFKVRIPKAKKEVDEIKIQQAEEERLRKEKETAYLAAKKKAEEEKLKKEMQDASLLSKMQAEEEARIRKEKVTAKKNDSMMNQHYNKRKPNTFVDPTIRRKELLFYGIFSGPTGDFGDNSVLGESGFAASGFGLGIQAAFPVGQSGFYFTTDFSLIYNPIDEKMFNEWNNDYYFNYELGDWLNIPITAGVTYKNNIKNNISVYGNFSLGINMVKGPDYYYEEFDGGFYYDWDQYIDGMVSTTAFSFGFGMSINKLDIGFRYLNLGEAEIPYYLDENITGWTSEEMSLAHNISMVIMTIGVIL